MAETTGSVRLKFNQSALNELLKGPSGPIAMDILRRTIKVERVAKQLAPKRTGLLASSINHRIELDATGIYGVVGTDVVYAPFQELGTYKMAAHPFLRPALRAAI